MNLQIKYIKMNLIFNIFGKCSGRVVWRESEIYFLVALLKNS